MKKLMLCGVLAAATPGLSAQAPTLKPGQYEITQQFTAPGQTSPMPPRKESICYTAKDLEGLSAIVGGKRDQKDGCQVVASKVVGSTLTFTTECAGTGKRTGKLTTSGEVKFLSPESYHAVVSMAGDSADFNGMKVVMDGKRTGNCTQ